MKPNSDGFLQLNSFPNLKQISKDPYIYTIDKFLSTAECKLIINMSEKNVQKSRVVDASSGQGVEHPSRTSESCYYGYDLKWLVSRVHRLTGVSQKFQEPTQVCRYLTGQFYQSHQDGFQVLDEKGQRIGTVLIYLNDVQNGGGTYFNNLNIRIQPKEGMALIFFPGKLDGPIDERMLHTAENASDIKWVSQVWLRNKQYSS